MLTIAATYGAVAGPVPARTKNGSVYPEPRNEVANLVFVSWANWPRARVGDGDMPAKARDSLSL